MLLYSGNIWHFSAYRNLPPPPPSAVPGKIRGGEGLLCGIEENRVDFFRYLKNSGQLLALFCEAGCTRLLSLYCWLNLWIVRPTINLWMYCGTIQFHHLGSMGSETDPPGSLVKWCGNAWCRRFMPFWTKRIRLKNYFFDLFIFEPPGLVFAHLII